MTQAQEKQAFLIAIELNKYDQELRWVFADWLEEHGFDDEAVVERLWTREKQEAEDWLMEFSQAHDIPYKDLIEAGKEGWYVQKGSQSAQSAMYEDDVREKFWNCWSLVTGSQVDKRKREDTLFSCSC